MLQIKEILKKALIDYISDYVLSLRMEMSALVESKSNETKSSAGDKFETSRAMMQQEIDKKSMQIHQWEEHGLKAASMTLASTLVIKDGALVHTDRGIYYFSTAIGKFSFDEQNIYALSTEAPIYQTLRSKKKGDVVSYNGQSIRILDVQ